MKVSTQPRGVADQALRRELAEHATLLNLLTDGRLTGTHNVATAAPTSGEHANGDYVRNSAPAVVSSSYVVTGWLCVTGGTPGTWVECRVMTAAYPAGSLSGLGTGVATFLATPSSANLAAAVTDDTGSGALVFGTAPTLANPTISGQAYGVQTAPTQYNTATTMAASDAINRITRWTGAALNLTWPTATDIEAAVVSGLVANGSFDLSIPNTGTGAVTLLTNTGLTLVGSMVVTNGTSGMFRFRRSSSTAYIIYRIA